MKYQNKILFFCMLYCSSLHALIPELSHLRQTLNSLERLLQQDALRHEPTYQELARTTVKALDTENPNLLDRYVPTIAVTTAKFLVQARINGEDREHFESAYILPQTAYFTQLISERYPNKNETLNCVSLASGGLGNEARLVRALRRVGYKSIRLVAIDIVYNQQRKSAFEDRFRDLSNNYNIPVSTNRNRVLQDGVTLELFQDAYNYISLVEADLLSKNHVMIMIHPGALSFVSETQEKILEAIWNKPSTPNVLLFPNRFAIYLPYRIEDSFVQPQSTDPKIKPMEDIIRRQAQEIKEEINSFVYHELYQKPLMDEIVHKFYKKFGLTASIVGVDLNIYFYDIIKHTALDPAAPLAFKALGFKLTQITKATGSIQDIVNAPVSVLEPWILQKGA